MLNLTKNVHPYSTQNINKNSTIINIDLDTLLSQGYEILFTVPYRDKFNHSSTVINCYYLFKDGDVFYFSPYYFFKYEQPETSFKVQFPELHEKIVSRMRKYKIDKILNE